MTKTPEWTMEKVNADTYHEMTLDFGVVDGKGRRVGCVLVVYEGAAYVANNGETVPAKIVSYVSAQRNGEKFGAIPPQMKHASVEEAKASVIKRGEQSRKRQIKQFGGQA